MSQRSLSVYSGALFLIGLAGFSLLMWFGVDLARWILPIVILGYFWPVFLSDDELARRVAWPPLYRFPLETALVVALLTVGLTVIAHRPDLQFWRVLGGAAAALACGVRGRLLAEARGSDLDRSLGALSAFVESKRWRPRPARITR